MAVADLAAISSALATIFEDRIAAQFNRSTVLAQLLPFQEGRAKNLTWDVKTGSLPGSSKLADGADVVTFNNDTLTPAVLQWGTYSEAFAVSGKALAAARATGNPSDLADLFADKIEDAVTRLTGNINLDMYGGSGSDSIIGLQTATVGALLATGTYGTIDKGAITQFAGNELKNGGNPQALQIELMREIMRLIYLASGEYPDLIVTDTIQHQNYGILLGDKRRFVQEVVMRGQKIVLDGGYRALEFDGIPVIADKDAAAGQMLFLNSRHVRMRQLADETQMGETGEDMPARIRLHGTAEAQLGQTMTQLTARINPLAVTGDAYKFQLVLYPQIQVRRPNACGILGDLAT